MSRKTTKSKFDSIVSIFENDGLDDRQKKHRLSKLHDRNEIVIDGSNGHLEGPDSHIVRNIPSFNNRLKMWKTMNDQVDPEPSKSSKDQAKITRKKLGVTSKSKSKSKSVLGDSDVSEDDDPFSVKTSKSKDTKTKAKSNNSSNKNIRKTRKTKAVVKKAIAKKAVAKKAIIKKTVVKKTVKAKAKPKSKSKSKPKVKATPAKKRIESESSDESSIDPFNM
jgi:hypothetical protein